MCRVWISLLLLLYSGLYFYPDSISHTCLSFLHRLTIPASKVYVLSHYVYNLFSKGDIQAPRCQHNYKGIADLEPVTVFRFFHTFLSASWFTCTPCHRHG